MGVNPLDHLNLLGAPKTRMWSRIKPNTKPRISGKPTHSLKTANSLAWRCIRFFKKKLTGRSSMPEPGPEKFISISNRPPNAKASVRRRPERPADRLVIGDCSVELRLAIISHAQDGHETDHFILKIFSPDILRVPWLPRSVSKRRDYPVGKGPGM